MEWSALAASWCGHKPPLSELSFRTAACVRSCVRCSDAVGASGPADLLQSADLTPITVPHEQGLKDEYTMPVLVGSVHSSLKLKFLKDGANHFFWDTSFFQALKRLHFVLR